MSAINFPSNPTNGETFVVGSKTYAYDSARSVWIIASSSSPTNIYWFEGVTADENETEIFLDGVLNTRLIVPNNTTIFYTADIICKRTNGTDFAAFTLKGVANNSNGTVTDIGAVYEIVVVRTDANIQVDVRADDINNSINLYVRGVSGKTLEWKAQVNVVGV